MSFRQGGRGTDVRRLRSETRFPWPWRRRRAQQVLGRDLFVVDARVTGRGRTAGGCVLTHASNSLFLSSSFCIKSPIVTACVPVRWVVAAMGGNKKAPACSSFGGAFENQATGFCAENNEPGGALDACQARPLVAVTPTRARWRARPVTRFTRRRHTPRRLVLRRGCGFGGTA